ncbi:CPBP family intramembrane metalloprotease [Lysinibacillus sp. BW-2-10]|nr:CPBP family intramembrane metalloprotease [Lysinibacillus sp. BW-2-10]
MLQMKKDWHWLKRISLAIVLTNVLIGVMTGLLIWWDLFDDLLNNFLFAHVMYTTLGVLNTLLIVWLFLKVDKKSPWLLGFQFTKRDFLFSCISIFVTLCTALVFIWLADQYGIVNATYHFNQIFTLDFYKLLVIASIGWFFAALKEEVLARGYFMANLNQFSIPKAIFISSILFMALHFIMGDFDPFKAASWLKGGIVYAYIYVKSGSLTVATIVHAAHNHINDLIIHGNDGALVLLASKIATSDKLIYEFALFVLLLGLTYLVYGRNGVFTPAPNLKTLWGKKEDPKIDAIKLQSKGNMSTQS